VTSKCAERNDVICSSHIREKRLIATLRLLYTQTHMTQLVVTNSRRN